MKLILCCSQRQEYFHHYLRIEFFKCIVGFKLRSIFKLFLPIYPTQIFKKKKHHPNFKKKEPHTNFKISKYKNLPNLYSDYYRSILVNSSVLSFCSSLSHSAFHSFISVCVNYLLLESYFHKPLYPPSIFLKLYIRLSCTSF